MKKYSNIKWECNEENKEYDLYLCRYGEWEYVLCLTHSEDNYWYYDSLEFRFDCESLEAETLEEAKQKSIEAIHDFYQGQIDYYIGLLNQLNEEG